ncbi:MAG: LysR family transcriptional regulator [Alphaproteobacteria bacterium]|nr:LysR family transcriptional regulator [Alphaproteobacteria bacterium]
MGESIPDWDGLRILLAVSEAGSLRGAAERLTLSQPTLGRRIRDLEAALGHPLLVRHARGVELTLEGRAVLEAAQSIDARISDLHRGLQGRKQQVAGRVRVSCTEPVAMEILPPSLLALRAEHPGLFVDIVVDARASDLDRREADLAIRMFRPERASLVARRVGGTFTAFYASRAYLARRGAPTSLGELATHDVLGPDRDALFVRQAEALGFSGDQMTFRTDSFATALAFVRAGVCIGALLGAIGEEDRDLVRLLGPIATHPVWLVSHPDLFASAAVRAVWDQLAADLPARFPSETPEARP